MEEQEPKSFFKAFLSIVFFISVLVLLFFYWTVPFRNVSFEFKQPNNNFSIGNSGTEQMQFYKNMRYPSRLIPYKIWENCTLKKRNDMEEAIHILENRTILRFYPVNDNEEISITCDDKIHFEGDAFVAGEGGPVNITKTKNFNVIQKGMVLLIEPSKCVYPNVALHELLHALGFVHSKNPQNVMYPITKCSQTLGNDIPELINKLYSYPSQQDLTIEEASAIIHGKYLDLNLTVKNNGLADSAKSEIKIYADNSLEKTLDLKPLKIGYGRSIFLKNIWIEKRNFRELKISVENSQQDLNAGDNEVLLKVKK